MKKTIYFKHLSADKNGNMKPPTHMASTDLRSLVSRSPCSRHSSRFPRVLRFTILLGLLLLSTQASIPAEAATCKELVGKLGDFILGQRKRIYEWSRRWKTMEGAKENSLNLLLKKSLPDEDRLFLGFVTKVETPKNLSWYNAPVKKFMRTAHLGIGNAIALPFGKTYNPKATYYLSVLNGLEHTITDLPNFAIRPVTKALLGQKMELRAPALIAAYYFSYDYLSKKYSEKLIAKVLDEADSHAAEIDEMMAHDYRFAELKNLLATLKDLDPQSITNPEIARLKELYDQGKLDLRQQRMMALMYSKMLKKYYSYMETDYVTDSPDEAVNTLMASPFFSHVQDLIANYEEKQPGFIYPVAAAPNLSQAQIQELFDLQHMTLEKQNIIPVLAQAFGATKKLRAGLPVNDDEKAAMQAIAAMKQDESRKVVINSVAEDEYTKFLLILLERGTIDWHELEYRLGEDAYYQRKFAEYRVIGVQRRVIKESNEKNAEGVETVKVIYSDEVLQLSDLRKINIKEIKSKLEAKTPNRAPSSLESPEVELKKIVLEPLLLF